MNDPTDRLDELIDQLTAGTGAGTGTGDATGDAEVDALARIADDLVGLPRETFRAHLAANLERTGTMTTASHIPEGLGVVTPYLMVREPTAAITFYRDVFAATEMMRHEEGGQVVHAKLQVGDSVIELGQHGDRPDDVTLTNMPNVGMHLYVADVDAVLARATDAGARVLVPIMDQPYGDREVSIADPFGVVWFIATHLHD